MSSSAPNLTANEEYLLTLLHAQEMRITMLLNALSRNFPALYSEFNNLAGTLILSPEEMARRIEEIELVAGQFQTAMRTQRGESGLRPTSLQTARCNGLGSEADTRLYQRYSAKLLWDRLSAVAYPNTGGELTKPLVTRRGIEIIHDVTTNVISVYCNYAEPNRVRELLYASTEVLAADGRLCHWPSKAQLWHPGEERWMDCPVVRFVDEAHRVAALTELACQLNLPGWLSQETVKTYKTAYDEICTDRNGYADELRSAEGAQWLHDHPSAQLRMAEPAMEVTELSTFWSRTGTPRIVEITDPLHGRLVVNLSNYRVKPDSYWPECVDNHALTNDLIALIVDAYEERRQAYAEYVQQQQDTEAAT